MTTVLSLMMALGALVWALTEAHVGSPWWALVAGATSGAWLSVACHYWATKRRGRGAP